MEFPLEIKVITNERYTNHISYCRCSNFYSRKTLEAMTYIKMHVKDKLDIIAHVLTRNGITVWYGIPEQIVAELKANGYKIKKRKHLKKYIPKDQPNL
jgi:hypothetical protein